MTFITPFSELSMADVLAAGGKGASLGEMTRAGIPVPPGFVVLTDAFERFLDEAGLRAQIQARLDSVNHREMETVERASEAIRALVLGAKVPEEIGREARSAHQALGAEYVAVRSSATAEDGAAASWAGELDSFLNVAAGDLSDKIRHCWASLFTPRAIFYRFENGFHGAWVSVAVAVQKMVASEVSGIAFSIHPVTENPNQLIIEAGYGLGEAIVSGSVTPDSYVADKRDFSVADRQVASQDRQLARGGDGGSRWVEVPEGRRDLQKLPEEKIRELASLVVRIERHYGFPCDIEWGMEDGILHIMQSRPITTLRTGGAADEKARQS